MRTVFRAFRFPAILAAWVMAGAVPAARADRVDDLRALQARFEAMDHGFATRTEWRTAVADLDALTTRAEGAADWDLAVETALLKARALAGIRGREDEALAVLRDARARWADHTPAAVRRVFVMQAELLARRGDEAGIRRLIADYRASPWYRPEPFVYSGGEGRQTPLAVRRPSARGSDDLILTAMLRCLDRATAVGGEQFPAFTLTDIDGRKRSMAALDAPVVLIDFWVSGWMPWHEQLPQQEATYRRYHDRGFEIIGVCQNLSATGLRDFRRRNRGAPWPQVAGAEARELLRMLGIYGDATNFLLDRNGHILGRDLHGSNLNAAVKAALSTSNSEQ